MSTSAAYITEPTQTDTAILTHSCKLDKKSSRDSCCAVAVVSSHALFKVTKLSTKSAFVYYKLYRTVLKWFDDYQSKLISLFFFSCSELSKTFKLRYCFEEGDQAYITDQGSLNPLNSRSRFSSLSLSFFYPGKVLLSTHALFQLNPVPH